MTNTNCLENIACPQCGNEDGFVIEVKTRAKVTDAGAETIGDISWDERHFIECEDCSTGGTVAEFTREAPDLFTALSNLCAQIEGAYGDIDLREANAALATAHGVSPPSRKERAMQTYNVHLYREMRLFFPGIEAPSHEIAALLATQKPDEEAAFIDDCVGKTLAALVDLVGDTDYSQSVTIDLDPVQASAQELYDALEALLAYEEDQRGDGRAVRKKARAALATSQRQTLPGGA